jgi:hypothetical protein
MVIVYLLERLLVNIKDFFERWYIKGTKIYFSSVIEILRNLDRKFAWKINLKNIFQPLYKDYSVLGYILGFFLRIGRILTALFIYVLFLLAAVFVFGVWCLILPVLFFYFLGIFYV